MNLYQKENIFVLWEKSLQAVALFGTGGGVEWKLWKDCGKMAKIRAVREGKKGL